MSEKTKPGVAVAVFVAIVVCMLAIMLAGTPGGWGRVQIILIALLVMSFCGSTWHAWQQQRRKRQEEERQSRSHEGSRGSPPNGASVRALAWRV